MSATVRSEHGTASRGAGRERLLCVRRLAPRPPDRSCIVSRALRLVVVLGLAVLCVCTTPAEAAATPWSPVALPWGSSWAVNDVYAFGATGLAAAGDDGHIGITRNGGASWNVVVPGGLESAVLTAIAVDDSGHGVVASGGLLLVRDDWAGAWHKPAYVGPSPRAALNDVARERASGGQCG